MYRNISTLVTSKQYDEGYFSKGKWADKSELPIVVYTVEIISLFFTMSCWKLLPYGVDIEVRKL